MSLTRKCTKTTCTAPAVATLTYVYSDRAAVLGPLATYAEPHTYDLCSEHAARLTAPRGWDVVRLEGDYRPARGAADDLLALADAVRESPAPRPAPAAEPAVPLTPAPVPTSGPGRRGHLRVVESTPAE